MLAICLPGSSFTRQSVEALLELKTYLVVNGIPHSVFFHEGSHVDRLRTELTQRFLDSPHQNSLWLDSDVGGDITGFVRRCLDYQYPFVAAPYRVKQDAVRFNVNYLPGQQPDTDGWLSVKHAGSGCMWISRAVFTAMQPMVNAYVSYDSNTPVYHYWASGVVSDRLLSEDYSLCERARQAGFSLFLCCVTKLTHTGQKTW